MNSIGDNDLEDEVARLNQAAIDLLVSVGMLTAVSEGMPEQVRENFAVKVANLRILIEEETAEFHQFGEAFDGEDEDNERSGD